MNQNHFACSEAPPLCDHYLETDLSQDHFVCFRAQLEPYKCNCCHFQTDCLVKLRSHSKSEATDVVNLYICGNCAFTTFSRLIILVHQENCQIVRNKQNSSYDTCVEDGNKWFKCQQCMYQTQHKHNLTNHIYVKHTENIELLQCNYCEYKTKLTKNLRAHVLRMHNQETYIHKISKHTVKDQITWFQCDTCAYKTARKSDLQRHLLAHLNPEEINWFYCDQCSYKTKQVGNLKRHHIYEHSAAEEIRWFQCESCPYKAKTKSHLKGHSLCHLRPEDIKWFFCDGCEYKTKRARDLRRHKKTKHLPSG